MGLAGIGVFLGFAVALILLGKQCERTDQAKREARYHEQRAERKGDSIEEGHRQVEHQVQAEEKIDQARTEYEQDRTNEDNRKKYMDSVMDRYR